MGGLFPVLKASLPIPSANLHHASHVVTQIFTPLPISTFSANVNPSKLHVSHTFFTRNSYFNSFPRQTSTHLPRSLSPQPQTLPSSLPSSQQSQFIPIPPVGVPYVANAPFMQKSNLPEGLVFITVGVILGFMGICVLAWRGLIVWLLHRSSRHAAHSQLSGNSSMSYVNKSSPDKRLTKRRSIYSSVLRRNSTAAIMDIMGHNKKASRHSEVTGMARPNSSLFFSPTADTARRSSTTINVPLASRASFQMPSNHFCTLPPTSTNLAAPWNGIDCIPPTNLNFRPLSAYTPSHARSRCVSPSTSLSHLSIPLDPASGNATGANPSYKTSMEYIGMGDNSSMIGVINGCPATSSAACSLMTRHQKSSSSLNILSGAAAPTHTSQSLPRPMSTTPTLRNYSALGMRTPSVYLDDLFDTASQNVNYTSGPAAHY